MSEWSSFGCQRVSMCVHAREFFLCVLPVADGLCLGFNLSCQTHHCRVRKRFNIFQRSSWAFRDGETLITSEGLFNVWWIIKTACFGLRTSVCHYLRSSPHTWHIHQSFTSVPFWLAQLLEKQSCSFFSCTIIIHDLYKIQKNYNKMRCCHRVVKTYH